MATFEVFAKIDATDYGQVGIQTVGITLRGIREVWFGPWSERDNSEGVFDIRNIKVGTSGYGSSDLWSPALTGVGDFDEFRGRGAPDPTFSSGVMSFDTSAGPDFFNRYGVHDLGGDLTDVTLTFDVRKTAGNFASFTQIAIAGGSPIDAIRSTGFDWRFDGIGNSFGGALANNTWATVSVRYVVTDPNPASDIAGIAPTCVVLGMAYSQASNQLVIPLEVTPPAGALLHVVPSAALINIPFFAHPSVDAVPTDTQSGVWEDSGIAGFNEPVLGAVGENELVAGQKCGIQLGETAIRVSGPDLVAGDEVTVYWNDNGEGEPNMEIVGVLLAFTGSMSSTVVPQWDGGLPAGSPGTVYGNGDSYTSLSSNPRELNWLTDINPLPRPSTGCAMIGGITVLPAITGLTPTTGAKIVEFSSPNMTLAVSGAPADALSEIEPGWTWGADAGIAVATYQFAEVSPGGLYAWQKF